MDSLASNCSSIGTELSRATWFYSDQGAQTVVNELADLLEKEVRVDDAWSLFKVAVKKMPGAGTAVQLYAIQQIIMKTAATVTTVVEAIEVTVEELKTFLALVADPTGMINERFDEVLAPHREVQRRKGQGPVDDRHRGSGRRIGTHQKTV